MSESKFADRLSDIVLLFGMPGLVFLGALQHIDILSVFLGAVAGGWLVVNWINAGHSAYVLRDEPQMIEDRDW